MKWILKKNQSKNVNILDVLELIQNGLNVVQVNAGIIRVVQVFQQIKHKKKLIKWIGNARIVKLIRLTKKNDLYNMSDKNENILLCLQNINTSIYKPNE